MERLLLERRRKTRVRGHRKNGLAEKLAKEDAEGLVIAGVDTTGGLKRSGGKRERYESLLRKFAEKQAGTVMAVREALEAGDLSAAEREVHSLKGAAATLGAVVLSGAASNVEAALKAGTDVDEKLESLASSLDALVQAINTRLPD
jgi:HPt (histidine-containing phosphotransfer) domain-containing protein